MSLQTFLFKKVELWVVLALLMVAVPGVLFFGWLVQHRATGGGYLKHAGERALAIASLPEPLMVLLFSEEDQIQPQRKDFSEFSGLKLWDTEFRDEGTLLVSSYSTEHEVAVAYLYDLQQQEILHTWVPPIEEIHAQTSYHTGINTKHQYRTQHPLLLENGDLIFTSGEGPLVRIDACSNLDWTIDRHFHHSIEPSHNGTIFVPTVFGDPEDYVEETTITREDDWIGELRAEGIAEVTLDGRIVREIPLKGILERNGYWGLLYGVRPYEPDAMHLNDIQPILETDDYVRQGDLALSLRHLSSVLLYRPETDEVLWLETGPWLNQHDVDYQGDGVFTIFGNDLVRGIDVWDHPRGAGSIWQYDQKTGETSQFLPLNHAEIRTETGGLHRVLDNGDVFVEETNKHVLHRVSQNGRRWAYVNNIGKDLIGATHWSRYLTAEESTFPWLDTLSCEKQQ